MRKSVFVITALVLMSAIGCAPDNPVPPGGGDTAVTPPADDPSEDEGQGDGEGEGDTGQDPAEKTYLTASFPTDSEMDLKWKEGDFLTVVGTSAARYEITEISEDGRTGTFVGDPVEGSSFKVILSSLGEKYLTRDYTKESRPDAGSDMKAKLEYDAVLEGLSNYADVTFSKEWATANNASFSQTGCVMLKIGIPSGCDDISYAKMMAYDNCFSVSNAPGCDRKYRRDVHFNTPQNSYDGVLKVYLMTSMNEDVIPAGTEVLVSMETAAYAYFSTITFDTDYTIEPGKVNVIGLESDAWIRRHKQEWASNATWTAPYTNVCHSSHGPGFLIDKVKVVTQSDGTVTNNGEASLWQYPWKSGQERVDHSYDWTYDAKVDGEFGKAPMVAIINLGQVEYVHTLWLQRRVLTNSATKYTTTGEIWFSNDTTGDELHSAHLLQNLTTGIYQDAHLHNYWGVFWKHKKWMKVADFKFGTKDQSLNTYPGGLHARYVMIVLKPDLKVLPSDGTPLLDMCEIDMKVFPRVAE